MNFEHLYKKVTYKNINRLKIYFLKIYKNNQIKKQKLKLGSISFEITEVFLSKIKIYEKLEMRFTKQDTSFEDSLKLENRLKNLEWKSDIYNIIALIIISIFLLNFLYLQFNFWYEENFSFLFIDDKNQKELFNFTFANLFNNKTEHFKNMFFLNNLLSQTLIDVFEFYN